MIDYAVELALTQGSGISSTVSSYKMWPRTVVFKEGSSIKKSILATIRFYKPM
jgi:hypothetical protein